MLGRTGNALFLVVPLMKTDYFFMETIVEYLYEEIAVSYE